MKQIKVERIMVQGKVSKNIKQGEQVFFEHPILIEGGFVTGNKDGNITITHETIRENIYGEDITPKVNVCEMDELMDGHVVSITDLDMRVPTDEEYDAVNEYLKNDWGDYSGWEDIKRHNLTVFEINEDFKIIHNSECEIILNNKGERFVQWETYSYAYKHGIIYPYSEVERSDDYEENLTGLF